MQYIHHRRKLALEYQPVFSSVQALPFSSFALKMRLTSFQKIIYLCLVIYTCTGKSFVRGHSCPYSFIYHNHRMSGFIIEEKIIWTGSCAVREFCEAVIKTAKRPLDSHLALPCEMRLYNQGARLQENVLMLQKFRICQD